MQVHLAPVVAHVELVAALVVAQGHDRADVLLRHEECHCHDGLAHFDELADFGHARGAFNVDERAVAQDDFIHHGRRGGDDVHVEFALEPLLHDFHVQQTEKPATKTKAKRLGYFRLIHQG